jgi:hypothetical protein
LTVWGDDGTSYTLEVANGVVRRGDGLRIVLSQEQVAMMATAFDGMVNNDRLANAVDLEPAPNADCARGGYCDASVKLGAGEVVGSTGTEYSTTIVAEQVGSGNILARRSTGNGGSSREPGARIRDVDASTNSDWPPNCVDISRAIHDATGEYRRTRSSVLNTLGDVAATTFEIDQYGRPTIHLPNLQTLGYVLEQQIYAKEMAELTLNVFATMYASYGCWGNNSSNWPASSFGTLNGSGTATGTLSLECHSEEWEISYDGGNTWSPITVTACEYME